MTHLIDWSVGVVIPAHNEEDTITRCIHSVREAKIALKPSIRTWIVVVADACTDQTTMQARLALGDDGEVVDCQFRSVGAARSLGVAAVLEKFRAVSAKDVWLANTDADTRVPLDWLKRQLEFASAGDTGVAGIVELDLAPDAGLPVQVCFQQSYFVALDGTHSHIHGANLGVRADAYLAVGGWGVLALAEDHCLWNRLTSAGWRLRSTILSRVITSARLHGRAPGGFADTLERLVAGALA